MLILLSPAKTLDFDTPIDVAQHSQPRFLDQSRRLITILRDLAPTDIAKLMKVSSKIADLNYQRFGNWQEPFTQDNARQAVLAFRGDVYTGLEADDFSAEDLAAAQQRLRILSGLYGLLRPLDLIQPYRLEMGTRLANPEGRDLYAFWGERLTAAVAAELAASSAPALLNLASNEYFAALRSEDLDVPVISPRFEDWSKGRYRFISFHAKKARGMLAGWVIRQRLDDPAQLHHFDVGGYRYCSESSTPLEPVFRRRQEG